MKIKVVIGREREEKHGLRHGIRRINLAFPNSLLKSRLAVTIIRNGITREKDVHGKKPLIEQSYITRDKLVILYKCLKSVIKQHGHFNLVEVHSADGTQVIIRL